MWKGKSNILVAVRVRPLSKTEKQRGHRSILEVMDGKVVVVKDPKEKENASDILRQNRSREKRYAFDYAFGPGSSSETVFRNTTEFLIDGVLSGFNATVFAYGATGAGKTFTMLGTETHPGIMFQTLRALFDKSSRIEQDKSQGVEYRISLSYLEVYNELIRDLLTPSSDYLELREDPIKGPTVSGISEISVDSPEHVMRLLQQGNKRRTQEPTAANKESSRSHAVLQIIIEQRDSAPGAEASVKVGKLSMIDLAGSERASNTQNRGLRLIEGANINRSLLALGNCINALGKMKGRGGYIPYRDSKLTRLLKDSLGGNCRTVMITNVSPASFHFEETVNSLKYANRAKDIKTNVKRNVLNVKYHISEYVSLIKGLKGEIAMLRGKLATSDSKESSSTNNIQIEPEVAIATSGLQQAEDVRHSRLFNELRTAIVANFRERMQLRRGQIEIESINVQNHIEIERRQATIARLEADLEMMGQENDELSGFDDDLDDEIDESIGVTLGDENDGDDSDVVIVEEEDLDDHQIVRSTSDDERENDDDIEEEDISFEGKQNAEAHSGKQGRPRKRASKRVSARQRRKGAIENTLKEIEMMRTAMEANNRVKDDIIRRLDENRKQSDEMHHDLSRRAKSNERRSLMELEYRVLQVELEKLELERSTMLQEMVVKQKNQILDEARQQLRLRDMIISAQRQLLEENNIMIGAKLQRMFERLVPMEAFWGTRGIDSGGDENTSMIAQVASELQKAGQPGDDWGVSEAVFPESKIKSIETVTYNPTISIRPNRSGKDEPAIHKTARSPRQKKSDSTSVSSKVQRVAAKVKRSKSSAYVRETNLIKRRLQSERKRRRARRRQRFQEKHDPPLIEGKNEENTSNRQSYSFEKKPEDKSHRDTSRKRERKKAKALQKRVLSASGKQWADRLKMYLVTPRRKNRSNGRSSSTKKAANEQGSPRMKKQNDDNKAANGEASGETFSAANVAKRISNALMKKEGVPSPQQQLAPPPPPKKASKFLRESSDVPTGAQSPVHLGVNDTDIVEQKMVDQNDENKVADRTGTPLPHIKPSGRWSPVNSPEQRGRRRTHREGKMDDDKRHGRGIRPVLHRLNAKLRRGRGRRRSKSREPRERSQTRSGTVMSELPTITNLAIEI
jgi:kinesin family protein 18/19